MYICGNLTCSPVLCKVLCTSKRETSGQCTVLGVQESVNTLVLTSVFQFSNCLTFPSYWNLDFWSHSLFVALYSILLLLIVLFL